MENKIMVIVGFLAKKGASKARHSKRGKHAENRARQSKRGKQSTRKYSQIRSSKLGQRVQRGYNKVPQRGRNQIKKRLTI